MTIQRSVACLRGDHINCNRSPTTCACDCHRPGATPVEDTIAWLNQVIADLQADWQNDLIAVSHVPSELLTEPTDTNAAMSEPLESQFKRLRSHLRSWRWGRVRKPE